MYNYFSDYEIQMSEKISKSDVIRAIEDSVLPHWFNKLATEFMFEDQPSGLAFPAFAGHFFGVRLFRSQSDTLFIDRDNFASIMDSDLVPDRLKDYIEKTYAPTQEEIDEQSKRIFKWPNEAQLFNTYNNIVGFFEKKHKTTFKKKSRLMAKSREVEVDEFLGDITFPDNSIDILFNMFDNYRNESIHLNDWNKLLKSVFTYM